MTNAMFGLPDGSGNSWLGQLFVMACYGFILFKAAVLIGDGSEKLLLIYGPGIVGGLIIPILGAVPDGAIVLVSGLGSAAEAQCQVSTGVGTLAGSTIMLLTIPWAFSLFLGCRDRAADGTAAAKANGRPKFEEGFKPCSSCVTTYANTVSGAKIMILTAVSYLIVLVPAMIEKNAPAEQQIEEEHYPALVGFIVCGLAFVAYSIFQVVDSRAATTQELEQTRLKFAKWQHAVGSKIGKTDNAIELTFQKFDTDGNGTIDRKELQKGFEMMGLKLERSQIVQIMADYQDATDEDQETLSKAEFREAIKKWSRTILKHQSVSIDQVMATAHSQHHLQHTVIDVDANDGASSKTPLKKKKGKGPARYQSVDQDEEDEELVNNNAERNLSRVDEEKEKLLEDMWRELNLEKEMSEEEDEEAEEQYMHLSDGQLVKRALVQLGLGTLLCVIFSDPMVSVIGTFSDTINVSSFYVSFIVTPIASNASEIYSALVFARKKTTEGVSMGFSALYGAACMNNTFVLCIFCALVFFRRLQWTFVAETLVIILTIIVVGINGMRRTVTVWQGFIVIAMFPLSLMLVALLDPVLDDVTSCAE